MQPAGEKKPAGCCVSVGVGANAISACCAESDGMRLPVPELLPPG